MQKNGKKFVKKEYPYHCIILSLFGIISIAYFKRKINVFNIIFDLVLLVGEVCSLFLTDKHLFKVPLKR